MSDRAELAIRESLAAWDDVGFEDTGHSTEDYVLAVGLPERHDCGNGEDFPRLKYCIVSRRYGVIEYSDSILSNALRTMNEMQRQLVLLGMSKAASEEDRPEVLHS